MSGFPDNHRPGRRGHMLPCSHILEDDELDQAVERKRCLCGKPWPQAHGLARVQLERELVKAMREQADATRANAARYPVLTYNGDADWAGGIAPKPSDPTLAEVKEEDRQERLDAEALREAPWRLRLELWWMRRRLRRATRPGFRLVLLIPNAPTHT
jgi:hypothetical protein